MISEQRSATSRCETERRFVLLDGLRGVAAILIVQRHTHSLFGVAPFAATYLAVDLFFLLSGFVVAHAYGDKLRAGYGFGPFAIERGIRLLPTYWVGLALAVFVLVSGGVHDGELRVDTVFATLALNAIFLPVPSWLAFTGPFILGQTWSLFAEVVSNILYGLFARFLTTPVVVCFMLCGAGIMVHTCLTLGHLDEGFSYEYMHVGIGRMLYSFFAGVFIYSFKDKVLSFIRSSAWAPVVITIFALFGPPGAMSGLYDLAVTFLILPVVVILASTATLGPFGRNLAAFGGAISYPLYVIHVPIIEWFTTAFPQASGRPIFEGNLLFACLFFGCLIVLSFTIATYFDGPLRRLLRRRLMTANVVSSAQQSTVSAS